MSNRNYEKIAAHVSADGDRTARMENAIRALWHGLGETGVSWVGFYLCEGTDEMILGPREPKPACSPIGMHGACGKVFRQRSPLLVHDVRELGENYVACDPRDQSEVVIPCLDADGSCWGVLDLDSFDIGSFGLDDVAGLTQVLVAAGLTTALD